MTTVAEIEQAIRRLTPTERERLAEDLPAILPELRGDLAWQRIISDPRPRPDLSSFGNHIASKYQANPEAFPPLRDSDFDEGV